MSGRPATTIAFTKMHGAANDFVVIDHRSPFLPPEPARRPLLAAMCDRRRGIGADGVLLLERDGTCDGAMVYYNADGGMAEFCGNGARCLARFAMDLGLGRDDRIQFNTAVGMKWAKRLADGRVELEFGSVGASEDVRVESGGRTFAGVLVTAGVPHFVVPVERVADVPLAQWSPMLRHHERFGAAGVNVDFVTKRPDGSIDMRTYERGVEAETLACGSGAIATAFWAIGTGARAPVTVRTAGGDDLVVGLRDESGRPLVTLTGPAQTVYSGHWPA
jgi:diaminopimelate epimerase